MGQPVEQMTSTGQKPDFTSLTAIKSDSSQGSRVEHHTKKPIHCEPRADRNPLAQHQDSSGNTSSRPQTPAICRISSDRPRTIRLLPAASASRIKASNRDKPTLLDLLTEAQSITQLAPWLAPIRRAPCSRSAGALW